MSLSVIVVNFIGAGIIGSIETKAGHTWSYIDMIYYSAITALTIGFGDYYPTQTASVIVAIFYIPISVITTTNFIAIVTGQIESIRDKRKREKYLEIPFSWDDLKQVDIDGNGEIDKFEFISFFLKTWGLVDPEVLDTLSQRFEFLDGDGNGLITEKNFACAQARLTVAETSKLSFLSRCDDKDENNLDNIEMQGGTTITAPWAIKDTNNDLKGKRIIEK